MDDLRKYKNKFFTLLESKSGDIKPLLLEQINLLYIPITNLFYEQGDNSKQIKLRGTDPNTKKTYVLKYNISGSYGWFDFDVNLRKISRKSDGSLTAQAQPTNSMVRAAMQKLVQKKIKHQMVGFLWISQKIKLKIL